MHDKYYAVHSACFLFLFYTVAKSSRKRLHIFCNKLSTIHGRKNFGDNWWTKMITQKAKALICRSIA